MGPFTFKDVFFLLVAFTIMLPQTNLPGKLKSQYYTLSGETIPYPIWAAARTAVMLYRDVEKLMALGYDVLYQPKGCNVESNWQARSWEAELNSAVCGPSQKNWRLLNFAHHPDKKS